MKIGYDQRWTARFWARADKSAGSDGCWPWLGSKDQEHYGVVYHRDRDSNERAHRKAWELTHGPVTFDVQVLHKCDNPICCNPAHLFTGTHTDNMRDKSAKGRWRGNPTKRVTVKCKHCGRELVVQAGRLARFKYCSRSCQNKHVNPVLARWKKRGIV